MLNWIKSFFAPAEIEEPKPKAKTTARRKTTTAKKTTSKRGRPRKTKKD